MIDRLISYLSNLKNRGKSPPAIDTISNLELFSRESYAQAMVYWLNEQRTGRLKMMRWLGK